MRRISVKVKEDHLRRLTKVKKPILAVAELIWNSLDADATKVRVAYDLNALGALQRIRVSDNGHGMDYAQAISVFGSLGGSWKSRVGKTREKKRLLHGKAGKGRFRAFSLGALVQWRSTFSDNGGRASFNISGSIADLLTFEVEEPVSSSESELGTEVTIDSIGGSRPSLFGEAARKEITEQFALYLMSYKDVEIIYDGSKIDPETLAESVTEIDLGMIELSDSKATRVDLTIIEWKAIQDRALFLCDESGFCLHRATPGIQAPGFYFTAYLKSSRLRELDEEESLVLEDMVPDLRSILDKGKDELRSHFRQRASQNAHLLVAGWKEDNVYPYEGEPATIVERAEREVFDVCALSVNEFLPEFDSSSAKAKRLAFNLLKEAVGERPEGIQRILGDVLELPREKQEELARLLEHTSLSAIINAAKTIADRLNFIQGLEILLFDQDSKEQLQERSQLQRILTEQTWIFGEEFHLTVDDQSLTEVLKQHIKELGREELATEPVLREDGSVGIVDLMLSRSVPQAKPESQQHLVIELKRPKQKIDTKAEMQIRSYATAVARDARFRDTDTSWVFWVISDEISDEVRMTATQPHRPPGLLWENEESRITIWVKTWAQLIQSCKGRLKFFQEKLDYQVDRDSAIEYLRETHRKYLPDVLTES